MFAALHGLIIFEVVEYVKGEIFGKQQEF